MNDVSYKARSSCPDHHGEGFIRFQKEFSRNDMGTPVQPVPVNGPLKLGNGSEFWLIGICFFGEFRYKSFIRIGGTP